MAHSTSRRAAVGFWGGFEYFLTEGFLNRPTLCGSSQVHTEHRAIGEVLVACAQDTVLV